MAKVKQLTVSLENQPGRLAAVAKALADAKIKSALCRLQGGRLLHEFKKQPGFVS